MREGITDEDARVEDEDRFARGGKVRFAVKLGREDPNGASRWS